MAPKQWVAAFLRDRGSGRGALYARYKPYRKERCRGVQVTMPE